MTKAKSFIFNILLIFFSVLFCLLVIEITMQLFSLAYRPTVAEKQQQFVDDYSLPYSYGVPRANVDLNLRTYFPSGEWVDYPVRVQTNQFGLRMPEITMQKPQNTKRVALMGDSSTFGWMVPQDKNYATILQNEMQTKFDEPIEVLNFGVPGYTSHHGMMHFARWVKPFAPDVVVLAYGFNDGFESRFEETHFYQRIKHAGMISGLSPVQIFFYDHSKLFRWVFDRLKSPAKQHLLAEHNQRVAEDIWMPRISQADYQSNLRKIIEQSRAIGAEVILLNLNLPNTWVKQPLQQLAKAENLPLLDVQDVFLQHPQTLPDEQRQSYTTPKQIANWIYTLRLRVRVPENLDIQDKVYVVGNHPRLGDGKPNLVAMNDDGFDGDETAGDGVWSVRIGIEDPLLLNYTFTHSGPKGTWSETKEAQAIEKATRHYYFVDLNELDVNDIWVSPIHNYGEPDYAHLVLPQDPIHPNIAGHALIAKELTPLVAEILK